MEIGTVLAARPLEFKELNADVLKKNGVNVENFDKNGDKKIDNTEIVELMLANRVSHYSELMKKESLKDFMKELDDCRKSDNSKDIKKYSWFGAAFGGLCGLSALGYSGIAGCTAISGLAILGITLLGAAIPAALTYFAAKSYMTGRTEEQRQMVSKEFDDCKKTYDKMQTEKEA